MSVVVVIDWQVMTPSRSVVLCADSRRDMEDWITAIRSAAVSSRHCYQVTRSDWSTALSRGRSHGNVDDRCHESCVSALS